MKEELLRIRDTLKCKIQFYKERYTEIAYYLIKDNKTLLNEEKYLFDITEKSLKYKGNNLKEKLSLMEPHIFDLIYHGNYFTDEEITKTSEIPELLNLYCVHTAYMENKVFLENINRLINQLN